MQLIRQTSSKYSNVLKPFSFWLGIRKELSSVGDTRVKIIELTIDNIKEYKKICLVSLHSWK